MFRAFGIGDLADKAREDFTSEDVGLSGFHLSVCICYAVRSRPRLWAPVPIECAHRVDIHTYAQTKNRIQGLKALAAFRAFARRAVERLGDVTDPNRLAGMMQGYAELIDSDDTLREMAARVEVSLM